jgi:ADP-ribose pyrophosphatase
MSDIETAPFEIDRRERLHDGFVKVDRYLVRQHQFAGGITPQLVREVVVAHEAVAVICYDPEREQVVMIEQARLPAFVVGLAPVLTEIVAGLADHGETPDAVARREVAEETGLELIGEPVLISHMITTPGYSTETVHVYCGRVDAREAGGIHGVEHEHEDLRVIVLGLDEFARRLEDGRIANSFSLVAGFWLMANRQRLRILWGLDRE